MKIKIPKDSFGLRILTVSRGDDKKIYRDTTFWYHLRVELLTLGYNVIYKQMNKDGHLVDTYEYYVRDKKWLFCIRDPRYVFENVYTEYNKSGVKELQLLIWDDDDGINRFDALRAKLGDSYGLD